MDPNEQILEALANASIADELVAAEEQFFRNNIAVAAYVTQMEPPTTPEHVLGRRALNLVVSRIALAERKARDARQNALKSIANPLQ